MEIDLVFTCEHASHRLPPQYGTLGVAPEVVRSHVSWDPGAADLACELAARFERLPFVGGFSRLLVDLNRADDHPDVIPQSSFGVAVPGNRGISDEERRARLRRYHAPYWRAVEGAVAEIVRTGRFCLLISVHTFTRVLDGQVRDYPCGVLFDEDRRYESEFGRALLDRLRQQGLDARANQPYRGLGTGVYAFLRRRFGPGCYAGIEIETCFEELDSPRSVAHAVSAYEDALRHAIARGERWAGVTRAPGV